MPRSIEDIIRNAINTGDFTPSAGAASCPVSRPASSFSRPLKPPRWAALFATKCAPHVPARSTRSALHPACCVRTTETPTSAHRASVNTTSIKYACTPVRLPWEITEETLRENIEGQNLENIITNMMTTQTGIDALDLY